MCIKGTSAPENELYIVLYDLLHQLPSATTVTKGIPSVSTFPASIANLVSSLADFPFILQQFLHSFHTPYFVLYCINENPYKKHL